MPSSCIKLWQLESALGEVRTFERPKLELEQYATQAHVASQCLFAVQTQFGELEDMSVADFGCGTGMLSIVRGAGGHCVADFGYGTGMLSIGASLLGAGSVCAVDIDADALQLCQENCVELEVDEYIQLLQADVTRLPDLLRLQGGDRTDRKLNEDDVNDTHTGECSHRKTCERTAGCSEESEKCDSDDDSSSEQAHKPDRCKVHTGDKPKTHSGNGRARKPFDGGTHTGDGPKTPTGDRPAARKPFDIVLTNPPFGTQRNRGADLAFVGAALRCASRAVYSFHKTAARTEIKRRAGRDLRTSKAEVVAQLRFDLPSTYKHHRKATVDIEVDFWRFEPPEDS